MRVFRISMMISSDNLVHLRPAEVIVKAELAGDFVVWDASQEAKFLKGRFAWVNWDVEELEASWNEIEGSRELTLALKGFMESTRKHKVCRSCCLKTSNFFGFYYAEQRWTPT